MKAIQKTYLGDGVYAALNEADQLVLTAENGISATNTIFIEKEVWDALLIFVKKIQRGEHGN